ncbi:MAG: DNA repair protein RecO [Clostridiales bacterium]|nr:DNA repair protein RecO [Clostridiales bacterium]
MPQTTDALIIREYNTPGEADRFVAALTRDLGLIHASARGARNLKSRNAAATQLLAYSRLSLIRRRDKYIIESAAPLNVFFEWRSDIARLALAQYFCELAGVLAPREETAEAHLRLMLNALHFLGQDEQDPKRIKAVLELRMLTLSGYMPELTACHHCGAGSCAAGFSLLPVDGVLLCRNCRQGDIWPLPLADGILAAMRHIVYSPFEKCFAFQLSGDSVHQLAKVSEQYLLAQLNRSFKTLDFYHTIN